ncbi:hypothetical protein B0T16DRAFT_402781 [Cercophora newfieldiana]|uniref:Uncharacterized protein n=1 Tax=Cercophora newfieldiana TaxID=92897 RepID=A0AA39YSR8_9PEZI|nr:hypothetical protein B0T16DRAFT_402781 [Cercophora newfieldiana]
MKVGRVDDMPVHCVWAYRPLPPASFRDCKGLPSFTQRNIFRSSHHTSDKVHNSPRTEIFPTTCSFSDSFLSQELPSRIFILPQTNSSPLPSPCPFS